jgi:hypothetical protein
MIDVLIVVGSIGFMETFMRLEKRYRKNKKSVDNR